jgi:glycosyltransferase involved in cell wall biosynthesis
MMSTEQAPRHKPLISISIPVLNEEGNVSRLYDRLCALAERMRDRCELEFVFSDNHSDDRTWEMLTELAGTDPRVRAIRFSRNFGFQRSILANYLHTRGDAVMQIDADLQDPPELLEQFFDLWQRGFQVIYGIRKQRREGALINAFRRAGYWVIDKISEHPIPQNVGDFRLVDRRVVNALASSKTPNPYLRGMIAGLGFRQTGVEYARDARIEGESKFGVGRLIRLGLTAIFNHSTAPLRIASLVGGAMIALSLVGVLYYVFMRLFQSQLPRGFVSTQILILFGIGLNAFLLGIIGEYLLRIYVMLRADPIAIVESSANFDTTELKL